MAAWPGSRASRLLLLCARIVVMLIAALVLWPVGSHAQTGGAGGAAADTSQGGAGGTGTTGNSGSNGSCSSSQGGGGGGGSAGGGSGGRGGGGGIVCAVPGGAGGAGGAPGGGNGAPGQNTLGSTGAGGGGGGGNGAEGATLSNVAVILGGNGGPGGSAVNGGGGGGAAGYGAIVNFTNDNAGSNADTISGGNGGNGGASSGATGGGGGDGGAGALFTAVVPGQSAAFINSGTINGGNGGTGTVVGAGGTGITGADIAITTSGAVNGGLSGDGATRANAITFTGGSNTLTLESGFSFLGNVAAFSAADTLRLGGTANATFDSSAIGGSAQFRTFGVFQKTGTSIWTLLNSTTATTPWTITAGTLAASQNGSLGDSSGTITLNGGALRFDASFTNAHPIALGASGGTLNTNGNNVTHSTTINGSGGLTKSGSGTLTLQGTHGYAGTTTVSGGTLLLGGTLTSSSVVVTSGGTLMSSSGTVDGSLSVQSGGVLAPGASPGIIQTGNANLESGSTLAIELNGLIAGSQHDRVIVTGTVTLGSGALSTSLGFTPAIGSVFRIIDNDGTDAVSGQFFNLAEGSTFAAGGKTFRISYVGGSGNDVTLTSVTDVSITNTGAGTVTAGNNVTYTITASGGTDDAADVTVQDVLPATETFVSLTAPAGFSCSTPAVGASGTVSCTRATFPAGATSVFTLVVNVRANTANGATVSNTATIATTSDDPSSANNTSTANTTVATSADLAIAKTGTASVTAGQNITYTITTTNNGPSDAVGVSVTDVLPSGTTFVSATPSQGSCSGTATVTCSLGTVANGASATITLVVSTSGSTSSPVSNTATISATTTDPASGDNTSTANTTVTPVADLAVTLSGPSSAFPGNLVYTATITNNGPSSAASVTLSDVVPTGLSLVSASATQGSCSGSTTVTCELGAIASGATAQVTITLNLPTDYSGGSIVNTVSVSASTSDPSSGNNSASVTNAFGCGTVSFTPATLGLAVVGQMYSQAFTLTSGTAPATFGVTGTLPTGLAFSGSTLSGTPTQRGAFPITVTATDNQGCVGSANLTVLVSRERVWAVGAGPGGAPLATTFTGVTATPRSSGMAYNSAFTGGVSVAAGDVNGDGVVDLITGAGPTGGPHVRVFNGANSTVHLSFFAYDDGVKSGVEVAAGDINGDGFADIVTTPAGPGPVHIKAFDGRNGNVLREFVLPSMAGREGAHVAAGDLTGDGWAEFIIGSGAGAPPLVQIIDGATTALLRSFTPYAASFAGGVFVAAGDITGDGRVEIITGAGPNGGPHVRVFDGVSGDPIAGPLASFFAYDPAFTGGVRVAAGDLTGDGKAELLTVPALGAPANVRIYDGATGALAAAVLALDVTFTGGATVAVANPQNRMIIDTPQPNATVSGASFPITGWAVAETAMPGAGADILHVWAFPVAGGAPTFVTQGNVTQNRGDIANLFGGEHLRSGFDLTGSLPAGQYYLVIYAHNATTGTFDQVDVVRITVN
jgi:fibronectin-binding autotransporter adhesin